MSKREYIKDADLTYKQRDEKEKAQINLLRDTLTKNGINPNENFLDKHVEYTGESSGQMGFPTKKIGTKEIMDFISDNPIRREEARNKIIELNEEELQNYHKFLQKKGLPIEYDMFKQTFRRQQSSRGGKRKTKRRIYGKGKEGDEKERPKKASKPYNPKQTSNVTLRRSATKFNNLDKMKEHPIRRVSSDPSVRTLPKVDQSKCQECDEDGMVEMEKMMKEMDMNGGKKRRRRRTLKKKKSKRKSRKYRKRVKPMDIPE
jgi:hypothetical protein